MDRRQPRSVHLRLVAPAVVLNLHALFIRELNLPLIGSCFTDRSGHVWPNGCHATHLGAPRRTLIVSSLLASPQPHATVRAELTRFQKVSVSPTLKSFPRHVSAAGAIASMSYSSKVRAQHAVAAIGVVREVP